MLFASRFVEMNLAAVAVVLSAIVAVCGAQNATAGVIEVWNPNCTFGMTAPLTGRGTFGEDLAEGVRIAFAEANVVGRLQLHLRVLDDGGNADTATANIDRLVRSEGVFGLIGTSTINSTVPLTTWKVPFVGPASPWIGYREVGSWVVCLGPSIQDIVANSVMFLSNDWTSMKSLAILRDSSSEATEATAVFNFAFTKTYSGDQLPAVVYDPALGMAAAVASVSRTGSRIVVIAARSDTVAEFVAAYDPQHPETIYFALPPSDPDDLSTELAMKSTTATVFTGSWLPDPTDMSQDIIVRYHVAAKRFGSTRHATYASIQGYVYGLVASAAAQTALFAGDWPLTRTGFYDAMFSISQSAAVIGQFVSSLSNDPQMWCNQALLRQKSLSVNYAGYAAVKSTESLFRSCGFVSWDTASRILFAQTAATTGAVADMGRGARVGVVAAFSEARQQIHLLTLDDGFNNTRATSNVEILRSIDWFISLAATTGTGPSLAAFAALNKSMALIGPLTGVQSLRRPFIRSVINVRPSYYDEMYVLASYIKGVINTTSVALLYQNDKFGEDCKTGLTLALRKLGVLIPPLFASFQRDDADMSASFKLLVSLGRPEVFVVIGSSSAFASFVIHARRDYPGIPICGCSFSVGEEVSSMLTASNQSVANIFLARVVPVLSSTTQIVSDYRRNVEESVQGALSLEGYIIGRFLSAVIDEMTVAGMSVTKQSIVDYIYSTQTFSFGGITLGPFSDGCGHGAGECCNQGSNKVYLTTIDNVTGSVVASSFTVSLPTCGMDYTSKSDKLVAILMGIIIPLAVCSAVGTLVTCFVIRKSKRKITDLENKAAELQGRLNVLTGDFGSLLHTPAEYVIRLLKGMQSKSALVEEDHENLEKIVLLIAQNKLYSANMQVHKKVGGMAQSTKLDDEIEGYLRDTVLKESEPSSESASNGSSSPPLASASEIVAGTMDLGTHTELNLWQFHPRMLDIPQDRVLSVTSTYLIASYGLFDKLRVNRAKFVHWIESIEAGYQDNPYHNRQHATDVLQAVHWLVQQSKNDFAFTDAETFAALCAAAAHDYNHPGVNSNFLVKTLDPLALRFNGVTVLENMHASESFGLMMQPDNNFIEGSAVPFLEFHTMVVQLVFATDMAQHVQIIGEFKGKTAGGNFSARSSSDRALALKLLIKMADLSNSVRPFDIYNEWTSRVCEEFFAQGDRERDLGLPISPFMDRGTCNLAKMQTTFLNIVLRPLVECILHIVPTASQLLENLNGNVKHWSGASSVEVFHSSNSGPIIKAESRAPLNPKE